MLKTYLKDEFTLFVLLRCYESFVLRDPQRLAREKDADAELTYFQPSTALHLAHLMSLTVWRPVVMWRSSASPSLMLTTVSKRKARPVWPLKFWCRHEDDGEYMTRVTQMQRRRTRLTIDS